MSNIIFHVIPSFYPIVGGAERQLERLARAQRNIGEKVKIITRNLGNNEAPKDFNDIEIIKINTKSIFLFNILLFVFYIRENQNIKFIHLHSCTSIMFTTVFLSLFLKFKVFVKITRIGFGSQIDLISSNYFKRFLFRLFKYFNNLKFIALTNEAKHYLLSFSPDSKVIVIPNGVNIERFSRPEIQEPINMIFVSRLISRKNILNSLDIICNNLTIRHNIFICGSGPEREKISVYIKENKLSHYKIFGELSEDNVFQKLRISHFFVLNSINEGLSNAFLEAISVGVVPVVSKNIFYSALNKKYDCLLFFDDFIKYKKEDLFTTYLIKSRNLEIMVQKEFNIVNIAKKFNLLYAS